MKSPFKFLDPYEREDIAAFFGREEETRELYSLVSKNRLTFVYGPSGTGKTSLVQCGLANRFRGVDWLPLWVRRGEDINTSLRRELGRALGTDQLYEGNIQEALVKLFNRYLRPVYLIFDQFEELFILGETDENKEREPFYQTISDIQEAELPCRILFIMREDYFGHLNYFEKVIPELYHRKLRVEPMSRERLREVLIGSCQVYGIPFGDASRDPDRILDNILAGRTGVQMPFVQVYLHLLYREAARLQKITDGRPRFDEKAIRALGPITDVLGRFLKEQEKAILNTLESRRFTPKGDLVRRVLDVFVSEEGTKIPLAYEMQPGGLLKLQGRSANVLADLEPGLLSACLEELEKSRILRRSERELEVAHDTLAALIDNQRSAELRQLREVRRRIETAYAEHKDSGGAYFMDAGQLARTEPFLGKVSLEPGWETFLEDSKREILLKVRKEQERVEQVKNLNRQRVFLSVITLALLVSIVLGFLVRQQGQILEANYAVIKLKNDSIQTTLDKFHQSEYMRLKPELLPRLKRADILIKGGYPGQARNLQREGCDLLKDATNNPYLKTLKDSLQCDTFY